MNNEQWSFVLHRSASGQAQSNSWMILAKTTSHDMNELQQSTRITALTQRKQADLNSSFIEDESSLISFTERESIS
jgi:hypothetical protein